MATETTLEIGREYFIDEYPVVCLGLDGKVARFGVDYFPTPRVLEIRIPSGDLSIEGSFIHNIPGPGQERLLCYDPESGHPPKEISVGQALRDEILQARAERREQI